MKTTDVFERDWIVQKRVTLMLFHVVASRKVCVVFLVSCRHWFSLLEPRKTDRSLSKSQTSNMTQGSLGLESISFHSADLVVSVEPPGKANRILIRLLSFPNRRLLGFVFVLAELWGTLVLRSRLSPVHCCSHTTGNRKGPIMHPSTIQLFPAGSSYKNKPLFLLTADYWWMMANWFPSKRKDNVF